RESIWIPFVLDELKCDELTVVVGHSSGAVAALRLLEHHKLLGVVLIAAYHTDLGDENERASGYFSRPWDWDAIKKNAGWVVQMASVDDPLVPIEEQREVGRRVEADYREFMDQGHFNWMDGLPELVDVIVEKMRQE
ncbi:putative hydrolase rbbp9, partial [Borealophlyctis nickersoniae]